MEKLKIGLEIALLTIGLLAAVVAVINFRLGQKIDDQKKIEEQRTQARIAESSAQAEIAKEEAAKALASAAAMNERANALELEGQKQKERAAIAERELLALKEKVKPRSLTRQQFDDVVAILKKEPKGKVSIQSTLSNHEAAAYAVQFKSMLESVGWDVESTGIGFNMTVGSGVIIMTSRMDDAEAIRLQKAFERAGIKATGQINKELKDRVYLYILDKPRD
jgi:hypothetical protein